MLAHNRQSVAGVKHSPRRFSVRCAVGNGNGNPKKTTFHKLIAQEGVIMLPGA